MSCPRSVRIPSRRGCQLAAVVHGPLQNRPTVVIAHGMLSSKRSARHRAMAAALTSLDVAAVRFDFAGRGTSSGSWRDLTPEGERDDLLGVLDWVAGRGAGPLGLVGSSLGGAICIMVAAHDPRVRALATWAAVGDFSAMPLWNDPALVALWQRAGEIEHNGKRVPWAFLEQARRIDLIALARRIQVPALIAHGEADQVVPISQAEQLAAAIPGAELALLSGADHRLTDALARTVMQERMARFVVSRFSEAQGQAQGPAPTIKQR